MGMPEHGTFALIQTFFKIIEAIKLNEPEIKKEASFIEKSYEILISKLSSDPQNYDRLKIHHEM